jgi:hypothetical protein
MTDVDRLTIDITVVRDRVDPRRDRHVLAKELFDKAEKGEVKLAIAAQGRRLDVPRREWLLRGLEELLSSETVAESPQLAYLSEVTFPSPDLLLGAHVPGFADAWDHVVATWQRKGHPPARNQPPGHADRFHVESHVLHGGDVFITDDGPLLKMCERLRDEHGIAVEAMRLADYLNRRTNQ